VENLEITEVVIVGILAALSALLGAAITGTINGIITYKVTKKQSDVQTSMLHESLQHQTSILHENLQHQTSMLHENLQHQTSTLHENLQHQTNEARRNRVIEARNPLLVEIREALSGGWGAYTNFVSATLTIQRSQSTDAQIDPLVLEQEQKQKQVMVEEITHLAYLTPQISDTKLSSQIETYLSVFNIALPRTDVAPEIPGVERYADAPAALTAARQHLFAVNKRIEELLAGDEPT